MKPTAPYVLKLQISLGLPSVDSHCAGGGPRDLGSEIFGGDMDSMGIPVKFLCAVYSVWWCPACQGY